jgi:hypothetical protein
MVSDYTALFEPAGYLCLYESVEAELVAIAEHRKAMSYFSFAADELGVEDSALSETVALAFEHGLRVSLLEAKYGHIREISVFVFREHDEWRVTAYTLLMASYANHGARWSDGAQAAQSTLLGYSPSEIEAHLKQVRLRSAGWGVSTLFLLLKPSQADLVEAVGRRYLPTATEMAPLTLIRADNHLPTKAARELLGEQVLARAAFEHGLGRQLFGAANPEQAVYSVVLNAEQIGELNRTMSSNVEFWTGHDWK